MKFQPSTMSGTGQTNSLVVVGGWMKVTLVFIFGPNLKTKTLLQPRPKLNKSKGTAFIHMLTP